jgi:hypothetical protein
VIALAFMSEVTSLGIGPKAAYDMAGTLTEHAVMVHTIYPTDKEKTKSWWSIIGSAPQLYHRGFIFKLNEKHVILIRRDDVELLRPYMPYVYITVEVDFLVFRMLNRIYSFLAGEPLSESKVGPNEFNQELLAAAQVALAEAPDDA